MGKATGFLEFERRHEAYEAPLTRVKHYKEFVAHSPTTKRRFKAHVAWTAAFRSATTAAR